MKNTLKRLLALFSSFLIFFFSIIPSNVSALSEGNFIYKCNSSDLTYEYMKSCYDKLLSNPVFSNLGSNYAVFIHFFSSTLVRFQIFPSFSTVEDISGSHTYTYYVPFDSDYNIAGYYCAECTVDDLSVYSFPISFSTRNYPYFVIDNNFSVLNDCGYCAYSNYSSFDGSAPSSGFTYSNFFISYISPSISSPDEPGFNPVLTPFIEGTNSIIRYKTGFLEWLNTYGKISVINSKGFKFVSSQLDLLVDVYNSYGNSPVFFFSSLTKTFNISTDIRGAYALLVTIRDLYQEYLQWKSSDELLFTIPKPSVTDSHPHWRDQEDYNLVTDTEEDTPVISILRDILRTLIYLPQNIASYFNFLEIRFNDIIYNFQSQIYLLNNLPDQISSLTYNSLINPLTEIKDAINNIDVSSPDVSVDVSISEEKQNEINTFFSDWNVKYSTAINEKIPVISQLSGLFNDQFFEKCGIDINGDGQVYQYYSTSVSYDSSSVSGTSSDSVSETDDVVNLLCSQFDNSDPNFLDDVSYSEDVPSLSISISGKKTEIFDFRLFAKYRTQIHTIMIFCIYSLYFLSLYKSLPSIIGNVSDVTNAFSDYKQSKKE